MKTKLFLVLITFCYLSACGDRERKILKKFNDLESEVKNNYGEKKKAFQELMDCFTFHYIKVIEFKNNDKVEIQYQMSDSSRWEKRELNIHDETQHPLLDDRISSEDLLRLKKTLYSINANRIWIVDLYNRYEGTSSKKLEIKYLKDVNGLCYYYEIYSKPLDSIPSEFYDLKTRDSVGGILDKQVIYYYK